MKSIKRRISSVDTTKKIMQAMDMVSVTKLQKARSRLEMIAPFVDEAKNMIARLEKCEDIGENIYFKPRPLQKTAYVLITSDRGLCGSHNVNLTEKLLSRIGAGGSEMILAVGLMGREYFKRRGRNIAFTYPEVSETMFFEDTMRIADDLISLYTLGKVGEAYMAYTRFESALTHVPTIVKLLPLHRSTAPANLSEEMRYEPDAQSFLKYAVPMHLSAYIYAALIESSACEQAARMITMDSAVSNADDIIGKLTRMYNHKRQSAITQEISEIVGSANM